MAIFETGRRLCLLFEAGQSRYAVEATSVMEVTPPDSTGDTIRGLPGLKDLSTLFGGSPEVRPGMAVVLDVSPTLALRVRRVLEVVDVARAPLLALPQGLAEALALSVRGALLVQDKVFLELNVESLNAEALSWSPPQRAVYLAEAPPERALVFESHGKRYGIALPLVSQVVPRTEAFCALPGLPGPMLGLFPQGQVLWSVASPAGLLGEPKPPEALLVLAELAGQNIGLSATRVLGVEADFSATEARGEFRGRAGDTALFLDLQRMFEA